MAYEPGWERSGRRWRDEEGRYRDDWERARRYRGEGYYGGYYGYPGEGESGRRGEYGRGRDRDDRGFFERAGDEVRSWFGDEDAVRRRMRDERGYGDSGWSERYGDPRRWSGSREREPVDREWARQWGYIERTPGAPEWSRQDQGSGSYGSEGYRTEQPRRWGESGWSGGPYAGRGPRGYQRADDRIKDEVCERMSQHGQLDASDIEVRVTNAEVTLQGSVNDRQAKRLAEDIAESVWGVREVHNQIRLIQGMFGEAGQPPEKEGRAA